MCAAREKRSPKIGMPVRHTRLFADFSMSRRLPRERLAGMALLLLLLSTIVQGAASFDPTSQQADDSTDYVRWRLTRWLLQSPIFGRDAANSDHHTSTRQSHRALQAFGEQICNLDPTMVRAYRNASMSNSAFVLENASSTDLNPHSFDEEEDDDERDNDLEYIYLQQCSCASRYGMAGEYCPSDHSNMCILRGPNAPILCFSSTEADAFVRTFWPITVAATLALLYALSCTFTGQLARQYTHRKLRNVQYFFHSRLAPTAPVSSSPQSTTSAASTSNMIDNPTTNTNSASISAELIDRDLNHLMQHQPEQAALLYRQYRTRERDRRQRLEIRHNSWWYKGLQRCCVEPFRGRQRRRRRSTIEQVEESPPSESLSPPPPTLITRSRLVLKTKVYAGEAGDAVETTANSPTATTSQSPLGILPNLFAPFTASDPVPSLQALDDEMEHGTRCAICLVKLQPGHVVGDLTCKHMMHKDCLKDWLKRRNTCPLCQQVNIATLVAPPPPPLHGDSSSVGAPTTSSSTPGSAPPTLPFAVASTPWSLRTENR
jgi:Ring finger domain